MKVLSVCGITRSGKTTTIEKIVEELTARGHRVGAVKNFHYEFTIDPDPNSNTGRYRKAGAVMSAACSGGETALIVPRQLPVEKLLALFEGECDYLVVEGMEDLPAPKIVTAHTQEDLAAKWSDNAICVSGRISTKLGEYGGKPAISVLDRAGELVDLIEAACAQWQDGLLP